MLSQRCKFGIRHGSERGGVSLVEMMAVVAVTAVLLGLAVCLFTALQRWDTRYRYHGLQGDQLASVAEAIRGDIRQAAEVKLASAGKLLVVGSGGLQVSYELMPEGCQRVMKNSDGTERIEMFTIGAAGEWKLEPDSTGRRPAVTLSLVRSDPSSQDKAELTQLLVYEVLQADVPHTAADNVLENKAN